MRHALLALLLITLAGCGSAPPTVETPKAPPPPAYRFTFVVDDRIAKTVEVPAGTRELTLSVQPRSGESPIWQTHGATNVFIELSLREEETTARGGRRLELDGSIEYYRDLKTEMEDGHERVVRGNSVADAAVEPVSVTVEYNAPVVVPLAPAINVQIALPPKRAQ